MNRLRIKTDHLEDNLFQENKITDKTPGHHMAPQFSFFSEPLAMMRISTNAGTCPRPQPGRRSFFPAPTFQGAAWPQPCFRGAMASGEESDMMSSMHVQKSVTALSDQDLLEFPDSSHRKPHFTSQPASPVSQGGDEHENGGM